jgi:hypothetical protein
MLGNDIQSYDYIGFGAVFEDLLATPPAGIKSLGKALYQARNNWERVIELWKPNDMPLKAMYDTTNRLGIGAEVFTFLHPDAVPAIEQFLFRKDISVPVIYYKTVEDLEYDLRFKRAIRTIFVPHKEQASVLGIRATVTPPTSAWVL